MLFGAAVAGAAQFAALADALADADASSIAYLASDDAAGSDGLASLTAALGEGAAVEYDADFGAEVTDFASIAKKAARAKPDAVVVSVATAQQAVGLLSALSAAGIDGSRIWLDGRTTLDYSTTLGAGALDGATGIVAGGEVDEAFALRLRQADPAVGASYASAAEAYDATIMAALAVLISGDDGGPAISRHLRSISTGGIACTSFGECASVLATEPDIDYTGRSGPLDLTETGDAAGGTFTIVAYAASNSFTPSRTVTAG
jgi:branched-chain amino acid transport system substrate-binding protein